MCFVIVGFTDICAYLFGFVSINSLQGDGGRFEEGHLCKASGVVASAAEELKKPRSKGSL